jgi:RNA polymerase sigma-70 factor, ECF subfamily
MSPPLGVELHGGDEDAFCTIIEAHRPALHAHCYRMLGSPHDADDALQDTLLRAWRALPNFRGRSPVRTWLYRIATNVCLDALARRPKRVVPIDFGPTASPGDPCDRPRAVALWIERRPDEPAGADCDSEPETRYERREALELALIAALEHLPARQRAVLILRDVLGFSAKEAAHSLETTVASVNGALLRARRAVNERLPEQSQHARLRTLGDRELRGIVQRVADAFERGDIDALLALLTETRWRDPVGAIEVDSQRRPSCGYSPTTGSSPASPRRRSSPICRSRSRKASERVEGRAPARSRPPSAQQEDCA